MALAPIMRNHCSKNFLSENGKAEINFDLSEPDFLKAVLGGHSFLNL
jgi:hypothetical protein